MPNGKLHDNSISDLLIHGQHPFPPDMEELILRIHALNPWILNELGWIPSDWEKGQHLGEGRILLRALLGSNADPTARLKLIRDYDANVRGQRD